MSIDVLQAKIRKTKNPSMICIAPSVLELPMPIKDAARAQYGDTLRAAAESYRQVSFGILDALKAVVPAVSILSGAYAAYACDGALMTVYLGSDSVKPFTQYCKDGKNVFIIARSSNKSAREVQDLLSGDRVVYQVMADLAMRWSLDQFGKNGYSEIGIAAAATNPTVLRTLREKYDRLFFLVPGYGTQGGNAKDVQYAFDKLGHGAAIMAGRSVLYAWQRQDDGADHYQQYARAAALKMREQILGYITVL